MNSLAEFKHPALSTMSGRRFSAIWRRFARGVDVDWYQVAVVATATFAIAMDLMFPPVRVQIGNGLDVYAGHWYGPLPSAGDVLVDFPNLAVELLVIVAVAVVGWRMGTRAGDKRRFARGPQ